VIMNCYATASGSLQHHTPGYHIFSMDIRKASISLPSSPLLIKCVLTFELPH